jgi:hypothetical protein
MGRWSAEAPFGRVGRRLGFRWIFPVGTMAVPFHPALMPLAVATLVVWTVSRTDDIASGASTGAGWSVLGLVVGFVVVGLLLSVPVLGWALVALGGRLVQALIALAVVVLLAVSAASGRDHPAVALVPVGFVALWLVQAVGGRLSFARASAAARRFRPVDVRGRAVVVPTDVDAATVPSLLGDCGASSVRHRTPTDGDGGRAHVRLTTEQADDLRAAARGALPGDATIEDSEGHAVLRCAAPIPAEVVEVDVRRTRDPWGLLGPPMWRVAVDGRSLVTGRAALVLPVPLLSCVYWVSLTSRSEWVVGFGRGRGRLVGPGQRALHELFAPGDPIEPERCSDVTATLALLGRQIEDRSSALDRLRAAALAGPVDLTAHRRTLDELRRGGALLLGPDAADVLATWLERARDGRQPQEPIVVARVIDTLPDDEIVRHGRRLYDALNSRKLALRWDLVPELDVTPLPRDLYRFGSRAGFGLALDLPGLYVRLGDLVPPFRALVRELGREMLLPEQVRQAQRRWDGES